MALIAVGVLVVPFSAVSAFGVARDFAGAFFLGRLTGVSSSSPLMSSPVDDLRLPEDTDRAEALAGV